VASGEAFRQDQLDRLSRARLLAERQTGLGFHIRVGALCGDPELAAQRMLTAIVAGRPGAAEVLVLVSPGQRFVRVLTSPDARCRISDTAAWLATLSMTSSFALGDLVGGLVSGIRQLADAAGQPGRLPSPAGPPVAPAASPADADDAHDSAQGPARGADPASNAPTPATGAGGQTLAARLA